VQKVTINEVKTKTGTGKKGDWTLVIIKDTEGAEYTSFDKALTSLGQGAVIELEPEITTKDGKTKINIKEWKLVSEGKLPASPGEQPAPDHGGYKSMDAMKFEESGRRYRQNLERISIERQTAYNGAISLISNLDKIKLQTEATTELNALILEALKWGRQALKATPQCQHEQAEQKPIVEKVSTVKTDTQGLPEFKTGVDLVNYAIKQGMKLDKIKADLVINNPTDIKDIPAAAAVLFGKPKSSDPNDPEGIFN